MSARVSLREIRAHAIRTVAACIAVPLLLRADGDAGRRRLWDVSIKVVRRRVKGGYGDERRQLWRPAVSEDRPLNHRTEFHLAFGLLSVESTTYLPVDLDLLRSAHASLARFGASSARCPPPYVCSRRVLPHFFPHRTPLSVRRMRSVGVLHVPGMSPAPDYEY